MSIVTGESVKCNSSNTNLECEGVIFLRLTFELISFGQDLIGEVVIGGPVEMKGETHWVLLSKSDCQVFQGLKSGLVRLLDHISDQLNILEDGQPEVWHSFNILILLLLSLFLLLGELSLLIDLLGQGSLVLVLALRERGR